MAVKRFYFFGSYSSSPAFRPFIMEVESDNNGEFTIPTNLVAYPSGYNYSVKTSDGQIFTGQTGNLTITFPSPNTHYDIEISGDFPSIYFNNGSERLKIKEIKQWGDIVFSSFDSAFYGCENLISTATDVPKIVNGCSFRRAFRVTQVNPSNIKLFDWAKISSIQEFMLNNTAFNRDISGIDLSGIPSGTTGLALFIFQASSFNNAGVRMTLDFLGRSYNLGTYPFNLVKVKEYEFLNSENISWNTALQSGQRDVVEVIIFHNRQTDIDFKTGNNNYPNLIPSGVKETIDAVDKTAGKILSLNPTVYANFETYLQGLGYVDIQDYLTQTSNNWTVIN